MRVTNKMLSNSFLRDMTYNLSNMQKLQEQLTSGKEFRRPSDDPFKVARSMQLHSSIGAVKQYKENIVDTKNWIDTTDTALNQAGEVVKRIDELLVSAGNGGYSENERYAIRDEINEKVNEFAQIMNTNFDGKYIFGGSRGTVKPLMVTGGTTYKNAGEVKIEDLSSWKDTELKITMPDGKDKIIKFTAEVKTISELSNKINEKLKTAGITDLRTVSSINEGKIRFINSNDKNIKIEDEKNKPDGWPIGDLNIEKTIVTSENSKLGYNSSTGTELEGEKIAVSVNEANIKSDWDGKTIVFSDGTTDVNVKFDLSGKPEPIKVEDLAKYIKEEIGKTSLKDKIDVELKYNNGQKEIQFISADSTTYEIKSASGEELPVGMEKYNGIKMSGYEKEKIDDKLITEISQGVNVEYNVGASDLIEFSNEQGETKDLRQIFSNIVNHLGSSNPDDVKELTKGDLQDIKDAFNNLLKVRAKVGAKQNRMESILDKNTDEIFNMTEILSKNEDIDITEKTMQFATMQTVYIASLQTSAKVLQPSLIDYVR